jgi:hypothetical protein
MLLSNFTSNNLLKAMSTYEDHYFSSLYTSSTPLALSHFLKKTPLEKKKKKKKKPLTNAYKFSTCPNQMNLRFEP